MTYSVEPVKGSPGAAIRRKRKSLGMTQATFAREYLFISKSFLSQLETGARGAREGALLQRLQELCGVDPKKMLALEPYHQKKPAKRARKRKAKS